MPRQRLRFGFLLQGAALFDSLTVFDNVAFSLHEQGRLTDAEVRERVRVPAGLLSDAAARPRRAGSPDDDNSLGHGGQLTYDALLARSV